MSTLDSRQRNDLDLFITGHYGEKDPGIDFVSEIDADNDEEVEPFFNETFNSQAIEPDEEEEEFDEDDSEDDEDEDDEDSDIP